LLAVFAIKVSFLPLPYSSRARKNPPVRQPAAALAVDLQ
jgi:hypothetical protein